MKFAEIIQATGNKAAHFPKAAGLDIILLDEKSREIKRDTLDFTQPILSNQPAELSKFNHFLDRLETGLADGSIVSDRLQVKLTSKVLVINHFQSFNEFFFR